MDRRLLAGGAIIGGVGLAWIGRRLLAGDATEEIEYTVERTIDDRTEIRRYPELVCVETVGESDREAFGRLFEYISGENSSRTSVPTTAPVRTESHEAAEGELEEGEEIGMTSPVRTDHEDGSVRLGFYLPTEYTPNTAPRPTDPAVSLRTEPPRSLATRRYSWWAFDWRRRRQAKKLAEALSETDLSTVGEPFALGYDAPETPPFLQTNEIAVEVEWETGEQ